MKQRTPHSVTFHESYMGTNWYGIPLVEGLWSRASRVWQESFFQIIKCYMFWSSHRDGEVKLKPMKKRSQQLEIFRSPFFPSQAYFHTKFHTNLYSSVWKGQSYLRAQKSIQISGIFLLQQSWNLRYPRRYLFQNNRELISGYLLFGLVKPLQFSLNWTRKGSF